MIGVGDYPHLLNGSKVLSAYAAGMGQLSSPPASARAFAGWAIQHLRHPNRPLASVAILLSDPNEAPFVSPVTGQSFQVPDATADDVEAAIFAWATRCAENPDNLAIFFFCGHGVSEGAAAALLLRDFGSKKNNAFDGAMNLGNFLAAMATRLPNRQLFLIDACRVSTPLSNLNAGLTTIGRTFLQAEPAARLGVEDLCLQSVLHSTLEGSSAYGRTGRPSVYTEALLKALKGSGGHMGSGDWWIETTSLQTALHHLITRGMALPSRLQVPETIRSATFEIHRPDPVEIATFVTVTDQNAMDAATLYCRRNGNEVGTVVWDIADGPFWEIGLEPDRYEFEAQPPGRSPASKEVPVYGPVTFVRIEV